MLILNSLSDMRSKINYSIYVLFHINPVYTKNRFIRIIDLLIYERKNVLSKIRLLD